ncbi:GNAT family N-acetyltransferase [uncultured Clostridium sp.]|uniref:GNAT family N-acetyltransferase n=1 Tax=uncultured Clostridium sp. TaxID=59620 RepID=UPI0032177C7C
MKKIGKLILNKESENHKILCMADGISIRKMEDTSFDYSLMAKWLSDPEVLFYYEGRDNAFNIDRIKEKYSPRILSEESVTPCIIELNQKPIGYVQYYYENDKKDLGVENYDTPYGIDVFIGETEYQNQGIGTKAIKLLTKYLFEVKSVDVILIDPQTWNSRAIKCYERCGFKAIKILEKREFHEGQYRDNLIMHLVRS